MRHYTITEEERQRRREAGKLQYQNLSEEQKQRQREQLAAVGRSRKGEKRGPMSEEQKQIRREKSRAWWASEEAKAERERARQRRVAYNKDEEKKKERLTPEARKRAGERLTWVNKTRERSEEELQGMADRMRELVLSGKCRRGPIAEWEKELHRQKALGNKHFGGAPKPMSKALRKKHSKRMKKNNPMFVSETVSRMVETTKANHGEDWYHRLWQRIADEGKNGKRTEFSEEERQAISERMKERNPMYRPEVIAKVMEKFTPERRQKAADRLKQTWKEGKIKPAMFQGGGLAREANKTERVLFPLVEKLDGRFVGDGTFWIKNTASGVCRNPDFIFGSGKEKQALLVHGTYWHRDPLITALEINDYLNAGWRVFVLWTKRISKWMFQSIEKELESFLTGCKQLKAPVFREFMTWNASRTTTS